MFSYDNRLVGVLNHNLKAKLFKKKMFCLSNAVWLGNLLTLSKFQFFHVYNEVDDDTCILCRAVMRMK